MKIHNYRNLKTTFLVASIIFLILVSTSACISNGNAPINELTTQNDEIYSDNTSMDTNEISENTPTQSLENVLGRKDVQNTENTYKSYYFLSARNGTDNNPGFIEMFATKNSLERLKTLNNELNNEFNFFELHNQPLIFVGQYDGDKKFNETFDMGIDTTNQVGVDFDGNEVISTSLKTAIIGKNVYNRFDDKILKGRNFSDSDFYINSHNEVINAILGIDYLEVYEIDDIIQLTLHSKKINFRVIGFYDRNTGIKRKGSFAKDLIFDCSIIIPFYDIGYYPTDENEALYQKIYYSQKNEGYIEISESTDQIDDEVHIKYSNIIEELVRENNLYYSIPTEPISMSFE